MACLSRLPQAVRAVAPAVHGRGVRIRRLRSRVGVPRQRRVQFLVDGLTQFFRSEDLGTGTEIQQPASHFGQVGKLQADQQATVGLFFGLLAVVPMALGPVTGYFH